jgi:ketosteroid isomerase-like protein
LSLYVSDDIEWHLPVSVRTGVRGIHRARQAVTALLDEFMTTIYDPSTIAQDVHVMFGSERLATIVFTMNAVTRWGEKYTNNYAITIECDDGEITRVYEVFDTKNACDTLDSSELG